MRGRARTRARTTTWSGRILWAWPTTLQEAKPKAGTIAGIVRLPTTRTDRGSEAQKPDRHSSVPIVRPCNHFPPGGRSPRRKSIGARTRERSTGTWARTSRNASLNESQTEQVRDSFSRGVYPASVHPRSGATLRRAKPQERRRAERGKNLTARPGRGGSRDGSGTPRARNGRGE